MENIKPEDVMRALECCANGERCNECPYFGKGMCLSRLHTDALALLREKDAEIERLTKERNKAQAICVQMGKQHQQELAQVRADAITEFVNRVKANCAVQKVHYVKDDEATITYELTDWQLDQIAKEMKGEKK